MNINIASVMDKVSTYAKSPAGKARMKKCIKQYYDKGITETAAGDKLFDEQNVWEAASRFIEILKQTAQGCDLPESVMEHINGLHSGSITKTKGGYEVPLFFSGDMHRDSLQPDKYEGVDNIITIFNNGYHAGGYVYGVWKGHGPDRIRSKKDRDALRFIQQAIMDFNNNYGSKYNVTAVAGDAYD